MSSLLSTFSCCFWWFLLGALLGWLLNKWLCKCCASKSTAHIDTSHTTHTSAPVAKVAEVPAAAPVAAAPAPAPTPAPAPAAKVAEVPSIDLKAARAAGFTIKNADDLTVIEGIGPKINELFKNAGLKTFAQVAAASVPQMRKILDDGGSRFRIANPGTWAQQAALAAANKWTELKKLQDELSAGLKK